MEETGFLMALVLTSSSILGNHKAYGVGFEYLYFRLLEDALRLLLELLLLLLCGSCSLMDWRDKCSSSLSTIWSSASTNITSLPRIT